MNVCSSVHTSLSFITLHFQNVKECQLTPLSRKLLRPYLGIR